MHGVEAREALAQPAGADRRERHRDEPLPDAARVSVLGDRRLRQPLTGSRRGRRREGDVVERADLGQASSQSAGGRLGAADLAGDEREEAEPDPHPKERIPAPGTIVRWPTAPRKMAILQGFLRAAETDLAALFEQLKQEVRRSGAAPGRRRWRRGAAARARAEAERLWPVSADRNLRLRPGVRGGVGTPAKAVLRKLMRWYVEPLAYDQRSFNAAALRLIDDLEARVAALEAELKNRS